MRVRRHVRDINILAYKYLYIISRTINKYLYIISRTFKSHTRSLRYNCKIKKNGLKKQYVQIKRIMKNLFLISINMTKKFYSIIISKLKLIILIILLRSCLKEQFYIIDVAYSANVPLNSVVYYVRSLDSSMCTRFFPPVLCEKRHRHISTLICVV